MAVRSSLAVRLHSHGGPEALSLDSVDVPEPGPGQVRMRQTVIGLNFIDTYHRSGLYPIDPLPAILGSEAAGVVEAVGPGVSAPAVGDRVAYCMVRGAYAERRLVDADRLLVLPAAVSDEVAAAALLKGLTAHYLLHFVYRVGADSTILVQAAAGGVGSILCQWAAALGARVIGTAGSEEKAAVARRNGCAEVILYRHQGVASRVAELTGGRGVDAVYDGVGRTTFDASLDSLAARGILASFGNASGPVPPLDLLRLSPKSLFVTRPTLATFVAERHQLEQAADELFARIAEGIVRIAVDQRFPLTEVRRAHEALEARATTGSTVLIPESDSP